ncbi:MAG: hypothetical protein J6Z09_02745 [Lachnospiraceae bacterium]|nr:hypothetical protein [Lachnospiraceae bacterium]MBP5298050.1 hypothetical protein [Lachnospiraceae bacterium]
MCRKIIVKEARKPMEIASVDEGNREDCIARYFDNKDNLIYVPLNVTGTLCLVLNNPSIGGMTENFLYPMEGSSHSVQRAMGTALFVHTKWETAAGKKTSVMDDITDDDLFFIRAFLDEFYQSTLRHNYNKAARK